MLQRAKNRTAAACQKVTGEAGRSYLVDVTLADEGERPEKESKEGKTNTATGSKGSGKMRLRCSMMQRSGGER